MSEMIERVAQAIDLSHWAVSNPPTSRELARAAIEAMREPTEAMQREMDDGGMGRLSQESFWNRMIDAALR
jgi:hypothetical protein